LLIHFNHILCQEISRNYTVRDADSLLQEEEFVSLNVDGFKQFIVEKCLPVCLSLTMFNMGSNLTRPKHEPDGLVFKPFVLNNI